MNHRRRDGWFAWIVLFGLVLLLPLAIRFWRRNPAPQRLATRVEGETGWPRTLVEQSPNDRPGRRVILEAPPRRVVSVTLATDEILMDMIDPQRIVALSNLAPTRGSLVAERVADIKHFVGDDVESIIALEPDLCFLASYNREELRSLLVDSGIPVFVFQRFNRLEDIRENLHTVGRAVGAEARADQMVAAMDRKLAFVAEHLPDRQKWPTALVYGRSGWVAGTDTVQTEVFEAAGIRNAAAEAGITGLAQVSEEQVLEMDPDYFVVAAESFGTGPEQAWLVNNPALASLSAIRDKRFVLIDEPLLSTVSHHIAETVAELARQVYPNRFPDDPS
jgi:iron complex transport system substrate-binding protein